MSQPTIPTFNSCCPPPRPVPPPFPYQPGAIKQGAFPAPQSPHIPALRLAGPTGWTGPIGPTGINGIIGGTGPSGIDGRATNTGATGWSGPTGAPGIDGIAANTGTTGSTGAQGIPGNPKNFTVLLNYSGGASISGVRIPPGLFSGAAYNTLAAGGDFTEEQGGDLLFLNKPTLTLNNTTYSFLTSVSISGFITSGAWQPISPNNIGGSAVNYRVTGDNSVALYLPLAYINGGNNSVYPSGYGSGYLVAVTLFYL